jgi:hypothetical protein
MARSLAEVLATAFTASAVIDPSSALKPETVEVVVATAREAVLSVRAVPLTSSARSTRPLSAVCSESTELDLTSPSVPPQPMGTNAVRPNVVATGPASALAKVP